MERSRASQYAGFKKKGPKSFPKTGKRGAPQAFAYILFSILENEPVDIASWSEDGRSFSVHEPDRFGNIILQKYFRHTNQSSFQRQLNLYGFRKVKKGPNRGSYEHESFLRDRRDLLVNVKRPRQASNKRGNPTTTGRGRSVKPRSASESSSDTSTLDDSHNDSPPESPISESLPDSPSQNAVGAAGLLTAASLADDALMVASLCRATFSDQDAAPDESTFTPMESSEKARRKESMDGAMMVASLCSAASTSSSSLLARGDSSSIFGSVEGALDGLAKLYAQTQSSASSTSTEDATSVSSADSR